MEPVNTKQLISLAERIIAGDALSSRQTSQLIDHPVDRAHDLLPGADLIREHYFGREVHLCAIRNVKSGRCGEDCTFCAQSVRARTGLAGYPLLDPEAIRGPGLELAGRPVHTASDVEIGMKGLRRGQPVTLSYVRDGQRQRLQFVP